MADRSNAPIIIKRKKVIAGGGHHGGAWKVAIVLGPKFEGAFCAKFSRTNPKDQGWKGRHSDGYLIYCWISATQTLDAQAPCNL